MDTKTHRLCPNPNVVFELGYAVHRLGWPRIVLMFNDAYGDIDDLPFDFKQHRITRYHLADPFPKDAKLDLDRKVKMALESILIADPKRLSEKVDQTDLELHERDRKMVEWVLSEMHIPTIENHITEMPHMLANRSLHFLEGVTHVILNNGLFHLNDTTLSNLFIDFAQAFQETVAYTDEYRQHPGGRHHVFSSRGDRPLSSERQEAWDSINAARVIMAERLRAILDRVRAEYPTIDIMKTNEAAWQDYRSYQVDT